MQTIFVVGLQQYNILRSLSHMAANQKNNPLHGKTLENILHFLVEKYGWETLGDLIRIKCFNENPSVQSSLKFLRKTEWARKKVEDLYLHSMPDE